MQSQAKCFRMYFKSEHLLNFQFFPEYIDGNFLKLFVCAEVIDIITPKHGGQMRYNDSFILINVMYIMTIVMMTHNAHLIGPFHHSVRNCT